MEERVTTTIAAAITTAEAEVITTVVATTVAVTHLPECRWQRPATAAALRQLQQGVRLPRRLRGMPIAVVAATVPGMAGAMLADMVAQRLRLRPEPAAVMAVAMALRLQPTADQLTPMALRSAATHHNRLPLCHPPRRQDLTHTEAPLQRGSLQGDHTPARAAGGDPATVGLGEGHRCPAMSMGNGRLQQMSCTCWAGNCFIAVGLSCYWQCLSTAWGVAFAIGAGF